MVYYFQERCTVLWDTACKTDFWHVENNQCAIVMSVMNWRPKTTGTGFSDPEWEEAGIHSGKMDSSVVYAFENDITVHTMGKKRTYYLFFFSCRMSQKWGFMDWDADVNLWLNNLLPHETCYLLQLLLTFSWWSLARLCCYLRTLSCWIEIMTPVQRVVYYKSVSIINKFIICTFLQF